MRPYKITNGVLVDAETGLPTSPPPKTNVENAWKFWQWGGMQYPPAGERFEMKPDETFIPSLLFVHSELEWWGEIKPPKMRPMMKGGKSLFPTSTRKGEITTSFIPVSIMGKVELVAVSSEYPHWRIYRTPLPLDTLEDAQEWQAAGFSERMDVDKWRCALEWKGIGAEDAAEYIRRRWVSLIHGRHFNLQDVLGIAFPVAKA